MNRLPLQQRQQGLGAIAAIMILVVLAALAAAITSFSSGQHLTSAQDVQSARALQAVFAGTEWGLHQALQGGTCATSSWDYPDDAGFKVTVVCSTLTYNEGESTPGVPRQVRLYRVQATACNGGGASCPDNAAVGRPGYVERQRLAVGYCEWNGSACVGP